jgi:hypothetical protein
MYRKIWHTMLVTLIVLLLGTITLVVAAHEIPSGPATDDSINRPMAPVAPPPTTIITVTTTEDTEADPQTRTCYYDGSIYSSALPCSFRRALVEASHRLPEDRPILIKFALDPGDPNYDSDTQTWMIVMDGDYSGEGAIVPNNISEPDGKVTIDGNTQPGGRPQGPKIIINSDNPFDIYSQYNIIRNLAFTGGGGIILAESSNVGGYNTVEHVWSGLEADGESIAFRDFDNHPEDLAGGGISAGSDYNMIRKNVIVGSMSRAIDIDGDNNVVFDNKIGTLADGTVPDVSESLKCLRSMTYYADSWYGGWGIQIGGSGNEIIDNTIAGLHQMQSENDTPPMALEIIGSDHIVEGNVIGVDKAGSFVGVCGQGIKVAGNGTRILANIIVDSKSGFVSSEDDSPTEGAIFVNDSSPTFGQITIRGNRVITSPGKVIEFGPAIPSDDALKTFNPAKITGLDGKLVTGTSGDDSPCPNCIVELYLDDLNDSEEAWQVLAVVTATASGEFVATLPFTLSADAGIRTSSTAQDDVVIGDYGAGTTVGLSKLYAAPGAVYITGPLTGSVSTPYTVTIVVLPTQATTPISYSIQMTDLSPVVSSVDSTVVSLTNLTWTDPGTKTITVTASNDLGSATNMFEIAISGEDDHKIYLPLVVRSG